MTVVLNRLFDFINEDSFPRWHLRVWRFILQWWPNEPLRRRLAIKWIRKKPRVRDARHPLTPDEVHEIADDPDNWDSEYITSGFDRWYITKHGGTLWLGFNPYETRD